MKVAIVYDRVNKWGGAERVLLSLHEIFPDAPLYTSVYNPETAPWAKVFPKIYTSFLQNWKWARTRHELLAPLMPFVFESFDFTGYDLVISVTSESAKGIITGPRTRHICYCLTPTRYLWSGYETYFGNGAMRWITQPIVLYLRRWDKIAAQRPDIMVGISKTVAARIKEYYGREVKVVYPPVDLKSFTPGESKPTPGVFLPDHFLIVSRLVPYKRVDLAIEAFNELGYPLFIVGTGSDEGRLKSIAKENIYFLGHLTDRELARYYEKASALIFPQEEDFGLVAVETQSMGTPVIAYKGGGALEIVIPGVTGEFFSPQTPDALIRVVQRFNKTRYNSQALMKSAEKFSKEKFLKAFKEVVSQGAIEKHPEGVIES